MLSPTQATRMGVAATGGAVTIQYIAKLADRIIMEIMTADTFVFRSILFAPTIQRFDILRLNCRFYLQCETEFQQKDGFNKYKILG
jgi:hypothetical protein